MVKTRGFRVELGDVEGALLEHGAVEDAAVVTTPHESLGAQLNAFVTLREDADASRGAPLELRNHCVRLLPQYMVPATINVVPLLPRNSNGKVDRRALLHLLQQDSLDATA